jgi:hypothetical protein
MKYVDKKSHFFLIYFIEAKPFIEVVEQPQSRGFRLIKPGLMDTFIELASGHNRYNEYPHGVITFLYRGHFSTW